jgi:hypothetical protein
MALVATGFLNQPVVKWGPGTLLTLKEDLRYVALDGTTHVAKQGLVTDLASVPAALRTLTSVLGATFQTTARAGILHDWIYKTGSTTRREADALFRESLVADGFAKWKARMMWAGVRAGGWVAWRRHRAND